MIVVSGATGNVGRPLVQALTVAGEDVTAVSITRSGHDWTMLRPGNFASNAPTVFLNSG